MKERAMSIRMDEDTHKKLRMLAAKEGKTAKQCIFEALDKTFPGWRDLSVKEK